MPLVAHNNLPTFERLSDEGYTVLPKGRALKQDIRELHVGLLNMMPDAALQATERQFFRLVGQSNQIVQIHMHPFTLPELQRSAEAESYIKEHYETVEQIKADGLDALIITGANVTNPDLTKNEFWQPLQDMLAWSLENVTSTLCSCLATHAVMAFRFGQKRKAMKKKLWGVYGHRVLDRQHPLVQGMNTIFDVPHSRFNTITRKQFDKAGLKVLVASDEADVHMAVSEDGLRLVCFQGHPEYDTETLLKEYKREILRYTSGEIKKYPPLPKHYFNAKNRKTLRKFKNAIKKEGGSRFPEEEIAEYVENTWRDTGSAIIGNWIGKVYQVTNIDRCKPFMDGINPQDPLGMKT